MISAYPLLAFVLIAAGICQAGTDKSQGSMPIQADTSHDGSETRPPEKKNRSLAGVVARGIFSCFEEGLRFSDGKPVSCETSAIAYHGRRLIVASDQPIPGEGRSSVFSLEFDGNDLASEKVTYFTEPAFLNATKYEAFAMTPDGNFIIATTGFDRVKLDSAEWNAFNTMLFWPVGNPGAVKIVSPTTDNGVISSVSLRSALSKVLKTEQYPDGVPYFKVEGLAAVSGDKLLLGIREMGQDYSNFDYVVKILAISYLIADGELTLLDDLELVYDCDVQSYWGLKHPVGLSGLEYDPYNERLYMLTSFEEATSGELKVGGFIWTLSIADLFENRPPTLVFADRETPLMFSHKPEGLAVVSESRLIVIHDDDRLLLFPSGAGSECEMVRELNQAVFEIVEFVHE